MDENGQNENEQPKEVTLEDRIHALEAKVEKLGSAVLYAVHGIGTAPEAPAVQE